MVNRSKPIIELRAVSKNYPSRRSFRDLVRRERRRSIFALRSVSLTIDPGEVVCLLGPNGAGKTTLLKIISGVILPDSGSVRISGHDTSTDDKAFSSVGLVSGDERGFYWRLSGYENLRFFAYLWGMSGSSARKRIDEVLDVVGLSARARDEVRTYSSGMKQRLAIARALLSSPPILLIDELARSLDYPSALDLANFVRELVNVGPYRTAIIATHQLWVAKEIASRVIILNDGRVAADDVLPSLLRAAGAFRFTVYLSASPEDVTLVVGSLLDAVVNAVTGGTKVSFNVPTPADLGPALATLSPFGILNVIQDDEGVPGDLLRLLGGKADE